MSDLLSKHNALQEKKKKKERNAVTLACNISDLERCSFFFFLSSITMHPPLFSFNFSFRDVG